MLLKFEWPSFFKKPTKLRQHSTLLPLSDGMKWSVYSVLAVPLHQSEQHRKKESQTSFGKGRMPDARQSQSNTLEQMMESALGRSIETKLLQEKKVVSKHKRCMASLLVLRVPLVCPVLKHR